MVQPVRRFAEICLVLAFVFGIISCFFASLSRTHLSLAAGLCMLSALTLYAVLLHQIKRQYLETYAQFAAPFGEAAVATSTPSLRHLLDSLDLQRRMMEQFFQQAPFGVLMVRHDGSVSYANPPLIRLYGYDLDEGEHLIRRDANRLFADETGASADLLTLLGQTHTAEHLLYLIRADGSLHNARLAAYPLLTTEAERSDGYLLFVQDISPAEQLKLLQQQCSYLLNSMNHGLVVIDFGYTITFANDAFCRMFDYELHEVLGETIDKLVHEPAEGTDTLSQRLTTLALESGENETATIILPEPEGRYRHIQTTATPIRDEFGNNIGCLLHYQDRTTEHELMESMRRNDQLETVSQMAASIAHEVRNPMTSVQGFLQLMSREVDPASTHSMYLHVMEEDLKRINSIITEYLNFSRMGSDSLEDVWIGTLLHNTYTLLQSEANLKGIQMALLMACDNPLLIANPNRIKQVLINLARNAMEAMIEQGGGTLTLALDSTDEHISITVKDTGPGIDASHLGRIFSPFYTTKKTGTGLGLYVCKRIIDEHNGTITVTTETGVGTTFEIKLPRNRLFEMS